MASWEKQSERLLKARYKLDNGLTWNYPPAYTGAEQRYYQDDAIGGLTSLNNCIPILKAGIQLVSRNPNLEYADDYGQELQYGLKYEIDVVVVPLIVREDDNMFEFIERFHAAPTKQIGYIEGLAERLVDQDGFKKLYTSTGGDGSAGNTGDLMIAVVNSQAKLDANNASGHRKITLHLRSSNTVPLASLPKYYYTGS